MADTRNYMPKTIQLYMAAEIFTMSVCTCTCIYMYDVRTIWVLASYVATYLRVLWQFLVILYVHAKTCIIDVASIEAYKEQLAS